jgi:hypothetical protein
MPSNARDLTVLRTSVAFRVAAVGGRTLWCGRWKADRVSRDSGTSTIEYVSLLLLIAAIVVALASAGLPTKVTTKATTAICAIFGGENCGGSAGGTSPGGNEGAPGFGSGDSSGTPPVTGPGGTTGSGNSTDAGGDAKSSPDWNSAYAGLDPASQAWRALDDQLGKFFNGLGKGLHQAGSGLFGAAWDDVKGLGGLVTHPMNAVKGLGHMVTHPVDTVKQLVWDDGSRKAWDDHQPVKAIFRSIWNVGSWFIPGYDLGKFGSKITKLGKVADEAGKLAKAADKAEKAAVEAERAAKAGDVERAGKAAAQARKDAEEAASEARKKGCKVVGLGVAIPDHVLSAGRFGGPLPWHGPADGCGDAEEAEKAAQRAEKAAEDAQNEKKIRDAGYTNPLQAGVRRVGKGIIDEREKAFNPDETKVAERLADEGKIVKGKAEGAERRADAEVDGIPTEFKTLKGKKIPGTPNREVPTSKTVKNALSSARGQSGHTVLDGRGSGITKEAAQAGIADYLRRDPRGMTSIRVFGDGWEIVWP